MDDGRTFTKIKTKLHLKNKKNLGEEYFNFKIQQNKKKFRQIYFNSRGW